MSIERHWMWLQALELVDETERLQRRFLRYLGPRAEAAGWEAPVDIQETHEGLVLIFALPGVTPEDIDIQLERTTITVSARRQMCLAHPEAVIHRLEIPHGHFVRRITLPGAPLEIAAQQYANGCLHVRLIRTRGRQP